MKAELFFRLAARFKKFFGLRSIKKASRSVPVGQAKLSVKNESNYRVVTIAGEVGIYDITES